MTHQLDSDDVNEALEIAAGNSIGAEISSRRTASQRHIDSLRQGVLRFLRELPADITIHEVLEAIGDEP